MNHPDFRVANRIFATLGSPDAAWGMVKLPLDEQQKLVEAMPDAFTARGGRVGTAGIDAGAAGKGEAAGADLCAGDGVAAGAGEAGKEEVRLSAVPSGAG